MRLDLFDALLRKEGWNIFTGWDPDEHPDFHLTRGMCDDFGCSDECRDFTSLTELFNYLQKLET